MPLLAGTSAPWFHAKTHARPDVALSSLGGRYVLLAFLPEAGADRDQMLARLQAHRGLFDDRWRVAFGVEGRRPPLAELTEQIPGLPLVPRRRRVDRRRLSAA